MECAAQQMKDGCAGGCFARVADSNLLFLSFDSSYGQYRLDVILIGSDGSNRQNLTGSPEIECCAQFSPDGNTVLYIQNDDHMDLFLYDLDTRSKRNITNIDVAEYDPVFAPDGNGILYCIKAGIYLMDTSGANVVQLTEFGDASAFSSDGQRIVFCEGWEHRGIWMVNVDWAISRERRPR